MCSEEASPRASFSHDSGEAEGVSRRDRDTTTTLFDDLNSDFEFNIASSSEQESCSAADELFANGFILPVQFQNTSKQKQKCAATPPPTASLPPLPRPSSHENSKKYFQITEVDKDLEEEEEEKPSQSTSSFWGFKRSSSLNCDATKKSSIRSLSLFSRSNSTGSVQKDLENNKPPPPRSQKLLQASSPSSTGSTAHSSYHLQQKKKNYVNGVKVSPVLNLPPPYISKGTANLFGLGSFLRSNNGSKDNKKNKK